MAQFSISLLGILKAPWPLRLPSFCDSKPARWKLWTCGADFEGPGIPGDSIFFTSYNTSGMIEQNRIPALRRSSIDLSDDGRHACSPNVFRHQNVNILNNQSLYFMYYECGRMYYNRADNMNPTEGFPQICLAFSGDGVTWSRYNSSSWDPANPLANTDAPATAVVKANQKIFDNCGYRPPDDQTPKHTISRATVKECDLGVNYGPGHPSAITREVSPGARQIWLFHYDTLGDWDKRGMYLRKSWDGIHFEDAVKTNLNYVAQIKYDSATNLFVATYNSYARNYFSYSTDGITFNSGDTSPPGLAYALPAARADMCSIHSAPSIVTDPYGIFSSHSVVNIFSSEGYLGHSEGTWVEQTGCFRPEEDVGRGTTWGVYLVHGRFKYESSALSFSYPQGYYQNGKGDYCKVPSWTQWLASGAPKSGWNVLAKDTPSGNYVESVTPRLHFAGDCSLPKGHFIVEVNKYWSNGEGQYCQFESEASWRESGGPANPKALTVDNVQSYLNRSDPAIVPYYLPLEMPTASYIQYTGICTGH